ncbi:hypothetical protein [Hugenholtzia roseola]|uniref:hypothetical protein n=1 Tax=Hugenholtzia roseola TaxID=1002 RepID=UPI0003F80BA9|nr:hypothetical protein [Hugenholtzia roseola]
MNEYKKPNFELSYDKLMRKIIVFSLLFTASTLCISFLLVLLYGIKIAFFQ